MEINDIKIFKIDFQQMKAEPIKYAEYGIDFKNYLEGLIELIISGSSGRSFRFDRDTTEVRSQIAMILDNNDFSKISLTIANRLLAIENDIQQQINKLGKEIQKGIIVQALITQNNIKKFIICKADNSDFLNETNFEYTKGLPIKKKVFKGFVCSLENKNIVSDILVYDVALTQYWWKDFLELTEVHSDEFNTQNAFDSIEKGVLLKIKSKHPQDYMHLSNSNIRYFRSTNSFDMNDYIQNMFDGYEPFDEKLDMEVLKNGIRQLPKNSKLPFDEQFSIIKSQIKKRFIRDIQLTPEIELHFKQEIKNIETVVTAGEDKDGTKYVKIKSEQGYQYFNKLIKN